MAEDLAAPRWFTTAEELAAAAEVDAVVVASSHHAHLDGILAAARHGKDVLCEKPITPTLAEADEAIAAVEGAGVRFQIGFMRRYDPAYVAAKRRIEAGEIGTPVLFKATHRNPSLPPSFRPASGAAAVSVFVDAAIHDYDNARWLLGDEVTEVQAATAPVLVPERPEDLALSNLRFARGGLGNVEVYLTCGYGYDVRTEIGGTTGTIFIGGLRETNCLLATKDGVSYHAVDHWLVRFGEAYLIELEDWVARMRSDQPPAITGADGRAAFEVSLAAALSAREGRTVRLPLE